jgi:hypothetical protein
MNETRSAQPRAKDRARKARLAKALRENLKRRKAQLRERADARGPAADGEVPGDGESKQR